MPHVARNPGGRVLSFSNALRLKVANVALMFAGVLLLLMQLHGYQHTRFADEFPLNKDEHFQIHENMDRNRDPGTDAGAKPTPETLPGKQQQ